MSEIWLTSDLHMMHDKPFLWEPRGFKSTEEMCEVIIERWNSVVKDGDWVYNLGDIALSNVDAAIPYLQKLKGNQVWILGNHDTLGKIEKIIPQCPNIQLLGSPRNSYATVIKSGKWSFYLSHYPTLTSNFNEKHLNQHLISLHGHTHQQTNFLQSNNPFLYHVGLDSHNCCPVNLEKIKTEIKNTFCQLKSDF